MCAFLWLISVEFPELDLQCSLMKRKEQAMCLQKPFLPACLYCFKGSCHWILDARVLITGWQEAWWACLMQITH